MAWAQKGNIKGPKGDPFKYEDFTEAQKEELRGPKGEPGQDGQPGQPGERGKDGVTPKIGPDGTWIIGDEDTGLKAQGPQGERGEDGKGIEIGGGVDSYADLPDTAEPGTGYLVRADGKLYIFDGSQFPAEGDGVAFRGPQGEQGQPGNPGHPGKDGVDGRDGVDGQPGKDGLDGKPGERGPRGAKISVGNGAPTSTGDAVTGDVYIDMTTGVIYENE